MENHKYVRIGWSVFQNYIRERVQPCSQIIFQNVEGVRYYGEGGGLQDGRVVPLQNGGWGGIKWGTSFGVVLTWVLQVLTILEGGHKRFPNFERDGA